MSVAVLSEHKIRERGSGWLTTTEIYDQLSKDFWNGMGRRDNAKLTLAKMLAMLAQRKIMVQEYQASQFLSSWRPNPLPLKEELQV